MTQRIGVTNASIVWLKGDLSTTARVGRTGDAIVIEWPGFVRMIATGDMTCARVEALSDVDDALLAKLTNGFGRAVPRYLRGAIVFHAAAIAHQDRAILLLGESGAGKSTTAALACAAGASMIADDTAVGTFDGDVFALEPLEASHWLDAPSRGALTRDADPSDEKQPVEAARVAPRPVALAAAAILAPHDSTSIDVTRIHGVEAAAVLLESSLRIPLGPERSKHDFDAIARLAERVPVFRVLRPRDFSASLEKLPLALFELLA